ncbi:hypothetical protein AFE_2598 [Acidithiobacillus ferrooxidans ATCC 23270]|uniref:Uncharacterized protein n=1 Tax=Acidithiobacillus ferrooxidans (strain ATCC 23270 / DSM 14882 / CIP 104768 / NCIMB 8455) TaxID=243159 RepID=B7J7R5_ACIF2|nr:hypothetical protein AFE_2598 [Acidithiobacillus ferrooxidans ATCC 23270]
MTCHGHDMAYQPSKPCKLQYHNIQGMLFTRNNNVVK